MSESVRQQSCALLAASTVGLPDQARADGGPGIVGGAAGPPELPAAVPLRTETETYNRRYEFVTRGGRLYGRNAGTAAWHELTLPACFAGRVASISADDDELIALDTSRRIYTMDGALKDATLFNWSSRWGPPTWTGPGYTLPATLAWSWSVISPVEDEHWTDPAGNRTPVGAGKVSHIWGLRPGGRRITFWDPWLPLDESYEMCGPRRGRFRAVNLSASGSFVFVVGRHGELFTRLYDFDISGLDPVFFTYSYEDQRGKGDGAPIQLPGAPWVRQPRVPGTITSAISIEKTGVDAVHRILRVEGRRRGATGYWTRDTAGGPWRFVATGLPLRGRVLERGRTRLAKRRGLTFAGDGVTVRRYQAYCSPARVTLPDGTHLTLHHVDGLRQSARGRGLDDQPREQSGALIDAAGHVETVKLDVTRDTLVVRERGWTLSRTTAPARRASRGR